MSGCHREPSPSAPEPRNVGVSPAQAVASAPSNTAPVATAPVVATAPSMTATSVAMPAGQGTLVIDVLGYEPKRNQVWIPLARDTGSVEIFDVVRSTFSRVTGFPVVQKEIKGRHRALGPSSVAIGDGVAYVGNRGTSEICVIETATLKRRSCTKLPAQPDGVVYLASAKEVWATLPHESAIVMLDAHNPKTLIQKDLRKYEGSPEGWAVDDARGIFYTNYEDKDRTLVIDIKTRVVRSTWPSGCGSEGPRGLALDRERNLLFVACTDRVRVLDPKSDGQNVGEVAAGSGVDLIDYSPATRSVYVAAGKAATLLVARVADNGALSLIATGTTAERARNAVVDAAGNAYVVDVSASRLLVFSTPR